MEENNVKTWETPGGTKITLVEDTPNKEIEEEQFDLENFKNDHEELFNQYNKKVKLLKKGKKGYVKITLGKDND